MTSVRMSIMVLVGRSFRCCLCWLRLWRSCTHPSTTCGSCRDTTPRYTEAHTHTVTCFIHIINPTMISDQGCIKNLAAGPLKPQSRCLTFVDLCDLQIKSFIQFLRRLKCCLSTGLHMVDSVHVQP